MQHLRIAIAEDEQDTLEFLEKSLTLLGHQVVALACNGRELVDRCKTAAPDLVITDIKMPQMDGLEAARQIMAERPVAVILLSAYYQDELIARAELSPALSYLVKPIREAGLQTAIAVALSRFRQFDELIRETGQLRQDLEDRKLIERAKGLLMKRAGIDEETAFRRLQKLATDQRCKLSMAATLVIDLEAPGKPGV